MAGLGLERDSPVLGVAGFRRVPAQHSHVGGRHTQQPYQHTPLSIQLLGTVPQVVTTSLPSLFEIYFFFDMLLEGHSIFF